MYRKRIPIRSKEDISSDSYTVMPFLALNQSIWTLASETSVFMYDKLFITQSQYNYTAYTPSTLFDKAKFIYTQRLPGSSPHRGGSVLHPSARVFLSLGLRGFFAFFYGCLPLSKVLRLIRHSSSAALARFWLFTWI